MWTFLGMHHNVFLQFCRPFSEVVTVRTRVTSCEQTASDCCLWIRLWLEGRKTELKSGQKARNGNGIIVNF